MTTVDMIEKLAKVDHLAINKWLVQICVKNVWYTEYFAEPPFGKPAIIQESKEAAIRVCLCKATQ